MNIDKFLIKLTLHKKVFWVSLTAFLPVIIMIGCMMFFIHSIMLKSDQIALAQQVTVVRSFGRRVGITAEKTHNQVLAALHTGNDSLGNSLNRIAESELFVDDLYVMDAQGEVVASAKSSFNLGEEWSTPLFSWQGQNSEWGVVVSEAPELMHQKVLLISPYLDESAQLLYFIVLVFNPSTMIESFMQINDELSLKAYGRSAPFNYTIDYRDATHRTQLLAIDSERNTDHAVRAFLYDSFLKLQHNHLVREEPFWQSDDAMLMFSVHKPMILLTDVLQAMGGVLVVAMVVCSIIALLLAWITMHHVVFADVEDVVRTMKALESGQLSKRSHVVRNDVMGVISLNINQMASAIERYTRELEVVSSTDGLTKVHNRVHFMKTLKHLVEETPNGAWRDGHIIMMDIDHFKKINDTHGHLVGDTTLQEVATLCVLSLADIKHIFARFGGEEFITFIYNGSDQEVVKWAMEIKEIIAGYPFAGETKGESFAVTISMGVTSCRIGSLKDCINRADHALYEAKNEGRNRVRLWQDTRKTEKK